MNIILASKSPRRREILENLGVKFTVVTADTDENSDIQNPEELVKELAYRKANAVKEKLIAKKKFTDDTVIIGSDTVVAKGGLILGKPKDRKNAKEMLLMLSGDSHSVISGVSIITANKTLCLSQTTDVYFDVMSENEINTYIDSGECDDKAGAYGIQGLASRFIKKIDGCYFNVVGLPVNLLNKMAKEMDIDIF
jgi:septum formation protein